MTRKRKVANDLFNNSRIIKNRKRIEELSEHEKKLNDAKKANYMNEVYYIKKLKITQT